MPKNITIPCLSVQQPFADLICAGVKTIENRTWNTPHRGTILIHASASVKPQKAIGMAMSHNGFTVEHNDKFLHSDRPELDISNVAKDENAMRQVALMLKWIEGNSNPLTPAMRTGAIIGCVDIVDVIPPKDEVNNPWAISGNYKWILENPEFLEKPILYKKGKLKLYSESVPSDLMTVDLLEWAVLKFGPSKS